MFSNSQRLLHKFHNQHLILTKIIKNNRLYSNWPFLNDDHKAVSEMAKSFADTELAPIASKIDKEHYFPIEQIKKLGELGMMGMNVETEYGGSGMDTLCYAIAMEEISRACASTGGKILYLILIFIDN